MRIPITIITLFIIVFNVFAEEIVPLPNEPLELSIQAKHTSWKKSNGRQTRNTDYILQCKNVSTNESLSDIRLEYCIYRDKNSNGNKSIETDADSQQVREIAPLEKKIIKIPGGMNLKKTDFKNEYEGCRIRAYITKADGTKVIQTAQYPKSLNVNDYVWNTEALAKTQSQKLLEAVPHWKYKVVSASSFNGHLEKKLNERIEGEWELYTILVVPKPRDPSSIQLVYRRKE